MASALLQEDIDAVTCTSATVIGTIVIVSRCLHRHQDHINNLEEKFMVPHCILRCTDGQIEIPCRIPSHQFRQWDLVQKGLVADITVGGRVWLPVADALEVGRKKGMRWSWEVPLLVGSRRALSPALVSLAGVISIDVIFIFVIFVFLVVVVIFLFLLMNTSG